MAQNRVREGTGLAGSMPFLTWRMAWLQNWPLHLCPAEKLAVRAVSPSSYASVAWSVGLCTSPHLFEELHD